MNDAGTVRVRIIGDDSNLKSTLSDSSVQLAKYGAAAALAAAAVTTALVKSGLSSADALAKQAAQLQTTSKDLAIMQRAADMAGISQGNLGVAARQLTTRLSQAAGGTGPAVEGLKKLNLTANELSAMPLADRIAAVTKSLQENVPASERAAVASQLFGE